MHIRYSDWKKPTDARYAFSLRASVVVDPAGFVPVTPPVGARSDIGDVAREVLGESGAALFASRVGAWSGPEDVLGPDGEKPYESPQRTFEECGPRRRLTIADIESVLRGNVLVLRGRSDAPLPCDYVLRDHHMIDVALYHYRTTGDLPNRLFHADRHSDYCRDGFLAARRPDQAATWWKLFEGLKRPDGEPTLAEDRVFFTAARAAHQPWMSGREFADELVVPWFVDTKALDWRVTLDREGALESDWVSVDLDYLMPSPQLALTRGLLRDARFQAMFEAAKVRVFVLSPQFTNGGDRHSSWTVQGHMHSSLRLINLLRNLAQRVRAL